MAAQIAQALNVHERVKRSTDLPLFYGRKDKDVVTANQLIDRVNTAATIAGWDQNRKCQELHMILRDKALLWWGALDNEEIPNIDTNWEELSKAFLKAYAPKYTAKTTCNIFVEMQQKNTESVQDYYLRVDEAFRRLCEGKPPAMTTTVTTPLIPLADVAAGGITIAQALTYKNEGVKQDEKYFLHQIFIAGLREEVRSKVMEANKASLKETVDLAREMEVIVQDKRAKGHSVAPIQEQEDEDYEDEAEQIEAIQGRGKRPFSKFGKSVPNQNRGGGPQNKFQGTCRYCKRYGHSQKMCRVRREKGAPLVDQNGKPYGVHNIQDEMEGIGALEEARTRVGSLNF